MFIQQCSIQKDNIITPKWTITIDGDKLIYVVQNSRIKCLCYNQDGERIPRRQNWFFQNRTVVNLSKDNNAPYLLKRELVLKLTNFVNSSYDGVYTCGIGKDLSSAMNTVSVRLILSTKPGMLIVHIVCYS